MAYDVVVPLAIESGLPGVSNIGLSTVATLETEVTVSEGRDNLAIATETTVATPPNEYDCTSVFGIESNCSTVVGRSSSTVIALGIEDNESTVHGKGYATTVAALGTESYLEDTRGPSGFGTKAPLQIESNLARVVSSGRNTVAPLASEIYLSRTDGASGYHCSEIIKVESDLGTTRTSGKNTVAELAIESNLGVSIIRGFVTLAPLGTETNESTVKGIGLSTAIPLSIESNMGNDVSAVVDALMLALYGKKVQASYFSNYNFDSFTEHNGSNYCCADDGIYLIGGADDAGDTITPSVTIDLEQLGDNFLKQLRFIHTDESCNVTVDLDGTTETYTSSTTGRVTCKHSHRGKSLKLTFSGFESLRDIEVFLYELTRR